MILNAKYHNFVMDRAIRLKEENPQFDENVFVAGAMCAYLYTNTIKLIPLYWQIFPEKGQSVFEGYNHWLEVEKIIKKTEKN